MTQTPETGPSLSRVLVVEDEAALRALLDVAIRDLGGLDALACGTCAEAIRNAAAFAPDLMVVDVQLSDGDGIDLVSTLRAQPALAHVPAVLLTARPTAAQDRIIGVHGIAGVLSKPFDPLSLTSTLTRLWLDWREKNGD